MKTKTLLLIAVISLGLGCGTVGTLKEGADKLLFKRTEIASAVQYSTPNASTNDLAGATATAIDQGHLVTGTNYSILSITNAEGQVTQEYVAHLEVTQPAVYKYEAKETVPGGVGKVLGLAGVPGSGMIGSLLGMALTGFAAYRSSKSRGEKVIKALIEANEDVRGVIGKHIEDFNGNPDKQLSASELDRKLIKAMKQVHRAQGVAHQVAGFVEKYTGSRNN